MVIEAVEEVLALARFGSLELIDSEYCPVEGIEKSGKDATPFTH
jgi:hypothetical protein